MKIGDLVIADPPVDDAAELAAFYSGFSWAEHLRKVCLAQCRELIRAKYVAQEVKITEARLDDLSRVHPAYLDFLDQHLQGRIRWEREAVKQGFGA